MQMKVYESLVRRLVPLKGIIELTEYCNLRCFFCVLGSQKNKQAWRYDNLINTINELCKIGTYFIEISGGEPLLYEKLPEVLISLRSKGFKVKIITNGVAITSFLVALFKELNIELQVSIHSLNSATYKKITGRDFLKKVLENVDDLKENGITVSVVTVINKLNYKEINTMINYWRERRIPFEFTPIIAPTVYQSDRKSVNIADYQLSKKEMSELLRSLNKVEWGNEGVLEFPYPCEIGKSVFCIAPDGTIYPCQKLRIALGNVLTNNISEIWNGHDFLRSLRVFVEDEKFISKMRKLIKNTRICLADNYNYLQDFLKIYPPVKEWDQVLSKEKI